MSQVDLARRMGRPQKTISEIVNGKAAITPETALELELVLRVPAEFWVVRERNYRTYIARRELEQCLQKDIQWAKRFPVKEMVKIGMISREEDRSSLVRNVLEFFGVTSSLQWEENYSTYEGAFRKPAAFKADKYALSAWLRAGIATAENRRMKPFNRPMFVRALHEARRLITTTPEEFCPALERLCAEAGVAVVFVPELPGSRASGATKWLSSERALIQLSLRYKTDDQLWFTFFHEAAHILLHNKKTIFLEDEAHIGREEQEANRWAADFLIPLAEYQRFVSREFFGKAEIRAFAAKLGLSPGIIVGRLQHDKMLEFSHCNDLKQRLKWVE